MQLQKKNLFEILFSLKSFTAAMLAIYLSMVLGLDNPSWAMFCVYVIALPFSGMALAKGIAHLLGTLFSAIAGMVLLLALHNMPLLHLLALALWLGSCLALSLLERSAYSYAFMISGYTALLISLPYVQSPETIFNVVLTRVEEIGLGIFCYMLIDLTVFPRKSHGVYQEALSRFNLLSTQWLQAISKNSGTRQLTLRQQLLQALRQCDELRQQALRDSHRLRGHEALLLELQSQQQQHYSLLVSVEEHLMHLGKPLPVGLQTRLAAFCQDRPADDLPSAQETELTRSQSDDPYLSHATLKALLPRIEQSRTLMDELLRHLQHRPSYRRRHLRFAYHQDPGQAIMIGAVAAASVLIAGLFWYYSGWSDGYVAVMFTGVACSLFATADNPLIPARGFFVYHLLVLPFAMLYLYGLFPLVSDFGGLVLVLAPGYLLGGFLMAKPAYAPIATPLVLGTTVLMIISNNSTSSPITLINMGIAQEIGKGLPLLVMGVLHRIGKEAASRRLHSALEQQLIAAALGTAGNRSEFESRHQELSHGLILRAGKQSDVITQACGASLRLGLALLHLGQLQPSLLPHGRKALQQARERIAHFFTLPANARPAALAPLLATLRHTLWSLTHPAGSTSQEIEQRFAAVLQCFETHPQLFAPTSPDAFPSTTAKEQLHA